MPTSVKIDGKSVELIAPFSIVVNRGTEPSTLNLKVRDVDGETAFDDSKNPVDIEVEAPGKSGEPQTLVLKNWYLVEAHRESAGVWSLTLNDVRFKARLRRITKEYNIYVATGNQEEARERSLDNGKDWTAYDAAKDAIDAFGLEFEETPVPNELKQKTLPHNLGNSLQGGFVEAGWDTTLSLLLEPIRCDVVPLANGKVSITDRGTDHSENLEEYIGVEGALADQKKHWSQPKEIVFKFESQVERFFSFSSGVTASPDEDIRIENVIPSENLNLQNPDETIGHVDLLVEMQRKWGISDTYIRRNWTSPAIIPMDEQNDDIDDVDEKDLWEGWLRECYRQKFKVLDHSERSIINLRFGHLAPDGSVLSERCVYMPYSYIRKYTRVYKHQPLEDILNIDISRNVDVDFTKPAPWLPVWEVDNTGEVLFQLVPQLGQIRYARDLLPGQTDKPISPGGHIQVGQDGALEEVESGVSLKPSWFVRVYYHGRLIADRPDLFINRIKEHTVKMFPEGGVDSVDYRVPNVTANYGYETTQDRSADRITLLNEEEIKETSERMAARLKTNFEEGRAGMLWTAGIDALVSGDYWVRGNVHSMTIQIGRKSDYSIECQWVVLPEVRSAVDNNATEGVPPRLIG